MIDGHAVRVKNDEAELQLQAVRGQIIQQHLQTLDDEERKAAQRRIEKWGTDQVVDMDEVRRQKKAEKRQRQKALRSDNAGVSTNGSTEPSKTRRSFSSLMLICVFLLTTITAVTYRHRLLRVFDQVD